MNQSLIRVLDFNSLNSRLTSVITCLLCFAILQPIRADEKPSAASATPANATDEVKTAQFVIYPAKPPYAAFKYRLLPHGMETTLGNAAPHYFRAITVWLNNPDYQAAEAKGLDDWMALPLDELNKNEAAQKFFNSCPTGNWDLMYLAARRERCDWDLPIREFNISTLIPELKQLRDLGRLLAFKARMEIARGQFDNAIETLKTGMAMARHAGQGPTLVNALVSAAMTRLMLDQVGVMMQQPKCPNLYWTLTALPSPIVDLRYGLEFEADFVYLYMPELRDIRTAVHTEAEWDKMLLDVADKLIKVLPGVGDQPKDLTWYGMGAMFALTAYPKAKDQLRDAGYTPEQIKAMSSSQAILTAEVETFEHLSHNIHKWFYADPVSAMKGLAEAEHELADLAKSKREIIPLASVLLPALSTVKSREVEADREVAGLRLVEAMRLYAYENHDQLPPQLGDIKSVPIPDDPMTGKPFAYELHDGVAVITSPPPPGRPASDGMRWEIRLAAAKK